MFNFKLKTTRNEEVHVKWNSLCEMNLYCGKYEITIRIR